MIDFNKIHKVHFIGIGGVSMHSLALFCKQMGWQVSGSDISQNQYTEMCRQKGVQIYTTHSQSNIKSPDFIIKSSAIKFDNPELLFAKKQKIKVLDRADFLNEILKKFPTVIAIAGTHGKSTTSAMLFKILANASKKVSCHIGADVDNQRLNINDDIIVLEACEYNKSFLHFKVDTAVVLNVEKDHLECYGSFFQLKNAFLSFLKHAQKRYVFSQNSTNYIHLKNLIRIEPPLKNFTQNSSKTTKTKFIFDNRKYTLNHLVGEQYVFDACVAIKLATDQNVPYKIIYETLKNFRPINRRQQLIGTVVVPKYIAIQDDTHPKQDPMCIEDNKGYISAQNNTKKQSQAIEKKSKNNIIAPIDIKLDLVTAQHPNKTRFADIIEVYIDYAHHPTEIKYNLQGFKKHKTLCIFQPHTFSRTKFLKDEFVSVLSQCDCIIYKQYSARETAKDGLSAYDLFLEIKKKKPTILYADNISQLKTCILNKIAHNIATNNPQYSKIIFFGAGDIDKIAKTLIKPS